MSFLEPEVDQPSPLREVLLLVEARWRGIVLSFILILTLWLAVQAFVALHAAYVYLGQSVPKLNDLSEQILPKPSEQILPKPSVHMTPPPITSCWRDRSLSGDDCFKASGGGSQSPPAQLHKPIPRRRLPNCDCAEI